ncbi:hypothetical protein CY34DRAFT_735217 [Suillus luteus UH-Slu-Lm8-n1]|uniref:Uncharacterized protein n=1 Tax=Suillus luteus UH-Slu-Lm8-n1 TaxID=930992 RepID=A0A0D0B2H2_9AGAM|nr:hypothetical protein CY34DRAFT_735217 [Suillus luteus UH-Slu-Lm8-n1]
MMMAVQAAPIQMILTPMMVQPTRLTVCTGKRFTAQGIHASIDYSDEPDQSDDNSDGDSGASYDANFWTEEEYVEATKAIQKICKDSKNVSQFLRSGGIGYKLSISHQFESSSEVARCAVQPGDINDLKKIVSARSLNGCLPN